MLSSNVFGLDLFWPSMVGSTEIYVLWMLQDHNFQLSCNQDDDFMSRKFWGFFHHLLSSLLLSQWMKHVAGNWDTMDSNSTLGIKSFGWLWTSHFFSSLGRRQTIFEKSCQENCNELYKQCPWMEKTISFKWYAM